MKKSLLIIIVVIILFFILIRIFSIKPELILFNRAQVLFLDDSSFFEEAITIAACPTFHYMLEKMVNNQEIITIKTQSTAESLKLLEKEKVNLIISGRALKPEEPDFSFKIIGPGYDFLFQEEILILEKEMNLVPFYTKLSLNLIYEQ